MLDRELNAPQPAADGPIASLCLTSFDELYASRVASWVTSTEELLWLAPGTIPPLTPSKVVAWGKERRNRYMLWDIAASEPVGYTELNPMPDTATQMWVGHFLLSPSVRGHSLGTRFAHALLDVAFSRFKTTEVLLVVFPNNAPAIRCYEKVGFEHRGEEYKHFKTTGRTHLLLRMSIDAQRFRHVSRSVNEVMPFVSDGALLRQGAIAARTAIREAR